MPCDHFRIESDAEAALHETPHEVHVLAPAQRLVESPDALSGFRAHYKRCARNVANAAVRPHRRRLIAHVKRRAQALVGTDQVAASEIVGVMVAGRGFGRVVAAHTRRASRHFGEMEVSQQACQRLRVEHSIGVDECHELRLDRLEPCVAGRRGTSIAGPPNHASAEPLCHGFGGRRALGGVINYDHGHGGCERRQRRSQAVGVIAHGDHRCHTLKRRPESAGGQGMQHGRIDQPASEQAL